MSEDLLNKYLSLSPENKARILRLMDKMLAENSQESTEEGGPAA